MATVFFNQPLIWKHPTKQEKLQQACNPKKTGMMIWTASNGKTTRELQVIDNRKTAAVSINPLLGLVAIVGHTDTTNCSFIFLNSLTKPGENVCVLGVFLNKEYGFDLHSGEILFSNYSQGNDDRRSQFAVCVLDTILEVFSYKKIAPSTFWQITNMGWKEIPREIVPEY